jgi:hypothetical protein
LLHCRMPDVRSPYSYALCSQQVPSPRNKDGQIEGVPNSRLISVSLETKK